MSLRCLLTLCFSKRSLLRPADMSTRRASECAPKCALRLLRREDATLGLSFTALPRQERTPGRGLGDERNVRDVPTRHHKTVCLSRCYLAIAGVFFQQCAMFRENMHFDRLTLSILHVGLGK